LSLLDLSDSHLFYLAFENSVCWNYVTEKFWTAIKHLTVPVILSRSVFDGFDPITELPPGSYIAADDFPDVKSLVDYLLHLQRTPAEYARFFDWTPKFKRVPNRANTEVLCEMCKWAVERKEARVEDIRRHWVKEARCKPEFALTHLLGRAIL